MSMSENNASTGIDARTSIASAELAASITSNPELRRLHAVTRRKRTSFSTIRTTGAAGDCSCSMGSLEALLIYVTAFTGNCIPIERTLFNLRQCITTAHMGALLPSRKVPRGLICESQARPLVRRNVPLLAPGRKGNRPNPDPGDPETGLLQLPFSKFGTLQPLVVSLRQLVGVAE